MLPSQREIQSELRKFIRIDTFRGSMLYLVDILLYAIFICGVLFLPELWMKVVASVLAGVKMSGLSVIAHDAAHNSLTRSKPWNKFIAVTSFLPCLFNYRLWLYDHNRLHHSQTNEDFPDSYTPFSRESYNALSGFRKWRERLYRKPSLLYFGAYYILERWSKVKLYPRKHMPVEIHSSAWRHFILMMVYMTVFLSGLAAAPLYSGTGTITAIILGFVVPFYVFQSLYAVAVYVQHTHPAVPWFDSTPDRKLEGRQEFISVNLLCPDWANLLVHNIFDHSAHHACPAIPCYQLGAAQKHLNALLGDYAITAEFSFKELFHTMEVCKLYDYKKHRWLDFEGIPTSDTNMIVIKPEYSHAA